MGRLPSFSQGITWKSYLTSMSSNAKLNGNITLQDSSQNIKHMANHQLVGMLMKEQPFQTGVYN